MVKKYSEGKACFKFEGRKFCADGATLNDVFLVGYLGKDNKVTNWKGDKIIGTYRITSSWSTPRSYVSSHMHQVEIRTNGAVYTGRSAGQGMVVKAIRKGAHRVG